jgi:RNA polymerase sigma-70 factor (ECF subfamily)
METKGIGAGSLADSATSVAERELIARSRAGDHSAFEALYDLHHLAVFRHAFRLLENADEADDIRQETFVRAYNAIGRYRAQAAFRTYLLAICGNLCRDRQRQRQRRPERSYGLEAPESPLRTAAAAAARESLDPLCRLERQSDAAVVWSALRKLTAAQREILVLRHVEGMELDTLAHVLGCSRMSVPVRLFRARSRFKDVYLSLLHEEGE